MLLWVNSCIQLQGISKNSLHMRKNASTDKICVEIKIDIEMKMEIRVETEMEIRMGIG